MSIIKCFFFDTNRCHPTPKNIPPPIPPHLNINSYFVFNSGINEMPSMTMKRRYSRHQQEAGGRAGEGRWPGGGQGEDAGGQSRAGAGADQTWASPTIGKIRSHPPLPIPPNFNFNSDCVFLFRYVLEMFLGEFFCYLALALEKI